MSKKLPAFFYIESNVSQASAEGRPVVALESTVITHGLPYPENLQLALDMEAIIWQTGATPATIGVLDGVVHVGLLAEQIERLARDSHSRKISVRDFASAIARRETGGTTVAGTLFVAELAGLKVFATGGIGGVHFQAPYDVSADLLQLARSPVLVVCAGAKAILDLPATFEMLETYSVPVVGYQTDEIPAFYTRSSGLPVSTRADTPEQAARIAQAHWGIGLRSAVLVTVPPPSEAALPADMIRDVIRQALQDAQKQGVHGQAVTPFLLQRVSELTQGDSLTANLALLHNNARVAGEIASFLSSQWR
jgi:pseudouridine-5'-phosphate glycosidase